MPKNELARRLQEAKQKGRTEGLRMAQQFMFDMMSVALHRQGWGYERIERLRQSMNEISDYFADALTTVWSRM